jgi:hypothetical protein
MFVRLFRLSGESNINSGDNSCGSTSPIEVFLLLAGDATVVDVVVPTVDALARDVDGVAVSEPLVFAGDKASSPG